MHVTYYTELKRKKKKRKVCKKKKGKARQGNRSVEKVKGREKKE